MKKLIIISFLTFFLIGCKNNFLKYTKWRVIKLEADSINNLSKQDLIGQSRFDSSTRLYQTFKGSIVITQVLNKQPDTSNYNLSGNRLIFFRPGIDSSTDLILMQTQDTLLCRSTNGIISLLVRVNSKEN